jgi:conserved oligomeric Golgi complex subunit 5
VRSSRSLIHNFFQPLPRLRQKIRVPYQSLQKHVSQLQRLQQASDVLRRVSRFVVLSRRLEAQMLEMDGNPDDYNNNNNSNNNNNNNQEDQREKEKPVQGASTNTNTNINGTTRDAIQAALGDNEDEKERTIAKAALSIAELGRYSIPFL